MPLRSSSSPATTTDTSATATTAQFGEVMPLRKKTVSTTTTGTNGEEAQFGDVMPFRSSSSNPIGGPQFGEVMSLKKPATSIASSKPVLSDVERLKRRKVRNIVVAVLSVIIAVSDYEYKYTHPATPIQLLVQMEKNSASVETIGRNSKPWAPCGTCHVNAFFISRVMCVRCDMCFFCVLYHMVCVSRFQLVPFRSIRFDLTTKHQWNHKTHMPYCTLLYRTPYYGREWQFSPTGKVGKKKTSLVYHINPQTHAVYRLRYWRMRITLMSKPHLLPVPILLRIPPHRPTVKIISINVYPCRTKC
mmetsp:Transcript_2037/g.2284  ORF Transcript_2037/g.2284 Transcript_2037/m.2284 type:complete len:303 (+) Transcript_2037:384-1292(+)